MERQLTVKPQNPWPGRFIAAAIIQGAAIVALTGIIVIGSMYFIKPDVARVIAAGAAGTWLAFGYIIYILVAVIGVAVSAVFYHLLGARISSVFAWLHLALMNGGATVAAGMMMYAGYIGGAAGLPQVVGGGGLDPTHVHQLIGAYVQPIGIAVLFILVGVLCGGVGYILAYRKGSIKS